MELADRIKELLGQGLQQSIVASAVGCDPSYISQLMEREEFKNDVLVARAGKAEGGVKRDNSWDEVEDKALARALETIHLIHRPTDLIRIAAMANTAKRRATESSNGSESASATVNLVLPKGANVIFQMNSQAQVVEVDGRSTAALPTQHLTKMMAERREEKAQQGVVEVAIPRAITNERKKVQTILEQIGFSEEPVPVPALMKEVSTS